MLPSFVLTNHSDKELLIGLKRLVATDANTTAHIVAHLAEIDARRLYLEKGCSSLFKYCTEVLHLSEAAAYRRIDVARVARRFPLVFEKLADGSVNLTTAQILGPCLTDENHVSLLESATHKSKEEVEKLAVSVRPRADVATVIRRMPRGNSDLAETGKGDRGLFEGAVESGRPVGLGGSNLPAKESRIESTAVEVPETIVGRPASKKPFVAPLSSDRYKIQVMVDAETVQMLRQLRDLLRHQVPNGDPAVIMKRGLKMLLEHVSHEKFGHPRERKPATVRRAVVKSGNEMAHGEANASSSTIGASVKAVETNAVETNAEGRGNVAKHSPQGNDRRAVSRHISLEVRRNVWTRDRGQCTFVCLSGRRCSEQGGLEFHHLEPYAWGGAATVDNIALRCRAHNAYEGERLFGERRPGAGRENNPDSRVATLAGES